MAMSMYVSHVNKALSVLNLEREKERARERERERERERARKKESDDMKGALRWITGLVFPAH